MLKYVFAIFVALIMFRGDIASVSYLNGVVAVNKYGDAYPQTCSVDGDRVRFFTLSSKDLGERGAALAMASKGKAGRAIWVDETHFFDDRLTPEFQHFVLNHECAHHELKHTDSHLEEETAAYQGEENMMEPEADCRAAMRLVELGYGPREFAIILEQVGDAELMKDLSVEAVPTEYNKVAYKPLSERVNDLKQCIGWKDGN